ncbi:MAG: hypothetical protein M3548_23150 [Actinomycetota bacterium]|nr:hypothetical protein [Actinomycetota bacterium]
MRLAFPEQAHQIPIDQPERAVREYAALVAGLHPVPKAIADVEPLATEAIEGALAEGAVLMAVMTPEDTPSALLTGVALAVPSTWDTDTAEALRDSVENVGADVRETIVVDTPIGPAVVAQRVPGIEQARARQPLTLQLQAFIPDPGTGRMLLLTLAAPSSTGWAAHQRLFVDLVATATASDAQPVSPSVEEDESFEHHTYRV